MRMRVYTLPELIENDVSRILTWRSTVIEKIGISKIEKWFITKESLEVN